MIRTRQICKCLILIILHATFCIDLLTRIWTKKIFSLIYFVDLKIFKNSRRLNKNTMLRKDVPNGMLQQIH